MIEFICHYITCPDSTGNIKEGDVHIYARDDADCRNILNILNAGNVYTSIQAAKTKKTKLTRCPECGGCGLMRSAVNSYTPSLSYDCDRCDATGEIERALSFTGLSNNEHPQLV